MYAVRFLLENAIERHTKTFVLINVLFSYFQPFPFVDRRLNLHSAFSERNRTAYISLGNPADELRDGFCLTGIQGGAV